MRILFVLIGSLISAGYPQTKAAPDVNLVHAEDLGYLGCALVINGMHTTLVVRDERFVDF